MFKVLNRNRKQVAILLNPTNPMVLDTLNTIGELKFDVPTAFRGLELEGYIQVEGGHEYVIKEIVKHGNTTSVVGMLNIEEILGMSYTSFVSKENTVYDTARLILDGTGWRIVNNVTDKTKTRNMYGKITNSYNLLLLMCTVFGVEIQYNTHTKTITIVDELGGDKGAYFISDLNLKKVTHDTHSHKFITRVIPVGRDGLTIESVNDGNNFLENKTYCNKNITGIWQSDRHTDPQKLKDDAQLFLNEMAVPYETYECVVDDLYKLRGNSLFRYDIGDTITLIDADTGTRIKQRVIQKTSYLLNPTQDTINIANKGMTFQEYYKRLTTIADMTENVLGTDGILSSDSIPEDSIEGKHIKYKQIQTEHLIANSITSELIQAESIDTKHLKADIIKAEHIQTGSITAGSGIIADGAIGNAMITELDAGKIKSGSVDTSLVRIQSESGNLEIADNTIQIKDDNQKVRVQIGKDASNDYNMYVFDKSGGVMFDASGITAKGITKPIIRDDMISDVANIDGGKLNISSVITSINDDTTTDLKTSKLIFDDTGQKFNVAFKQLTTTVDDQGKEFTDFKATEFKAEQGKISSLIQDTTIIKDGEEYKLKDEFTSFEQTTKGFFDKVTSIEGDYVKQAEFNKTVDGLEIKVSKYGYDNKLLNGKALNGTKHWSTWGNATLQVTDSMFHVYSDITNPNANFGIVSNEIYLVKDQEYSIGFNHASFFNAGVLNYNFILSDLGNRQLDLVFNNDSGTLKYMTGTFVSPITGNCKLLLGYSGNVTQGTTGFKVSDLCLVDGSKPRPFIPNPNELNTGVTNIDDEGWKVTHTGGSFSRTNAKEFYQANENGDRTISVRFGGLRLYKFDHDKTFLGGLSSTSDSADRTRYRVGLFNTRNAVSTFMGVTEYAEDGQATNMQLYVNCNNGGDIYNSGVNLLKPVTFYDTINVNNRHLDNILASKYRHYGTQFVDDGGFLIQGALYGSGLGTSNSNGVIPLLKVSDAEVSSFRPLNMNGNAIIGSQSVMELTPQTSRLRARNILPTENNVYGTMSYTENEIRFSGSVFTSNGYAMVELPQIIAENIQSDYKVTVGKYGFGDYYIGEKTNYYFELHSEKDIKFDFEVIAKKVDRFNTTLFSRELYIQSEAPIEPVESFDNSILSHSKYGLEDDMYIDEQLYIEELKRKNELYKLYRG